VGKLISRNQIKEKGKNNMGLMKEGSDFGQFEDTKGNNEIGFNNERRIFQIICNIF
jgi:hypothetical protein